MSEVAEVVAENTQVQQPEYKPETQIILAKPSAEVAESSEGQMSDESKPQGGVLNFSQLIEKANAPKPEVLSGKLDPVKKLAEALDLSGVSEVAKSDPEVVALLKNLSEKVQAITGKSEAQTSTETVVPAPAESGVTASPEVTEKIKTPKKTKTAKAKKAKETAMQTSVEGKKAKKTKAAAKTTKKVATDTWAQNGPPMKLTLNDLNDKERQILKQLSGISDVIPPKGIKEIAAETYPDQPPEKANSWVRNSLRRLVRSKLVEKVERGNYRVSKKALNALFTSALKPATGGSGN